ncbi:MAG: hypothetical protein GY827_02980 [Cytophagales bacterium]|nr:hypothetical protein [Cytophagales bacterium]
MIQSIPKSLKYIFEATKSQDSFAHTAIWTEKGEAYCLMVSFPTMPFDAKVKVENNKIVIYNAHHEVAYSLPTNAEISKYKVKNYINKMEVIIEKQTSWKKYLLEDLQRIDDAYILEDENGKLSFFEKIKQDITSFFSKLRL